MRQAVEIVAGEVVAHAEAAQQLGLLHAAGFALQQPQAGDVGEPDLAVAREHAGGDAVELAVEAVGVDAALVGDAVVIRVFDQAHDFALDGEILGLLAEHLCDAGRRGPRWCARRDRARACPCSRGCRARWCDNDRSPRRTAAPSRRSRWPRDWRAWARRPTAKPCSPLGKRESLDRQLAHRPRPDRRPASAGARRVRAAGSARRRWRFLRRKTTARRASRTEGFMVSRKSGRAFSGARTIDVTRLPAGRLNCSSFG